MYSGAGSTSRARFMRRILTVLLSSTRSQCSVYHIWLKHAWILVGWHNQNEPKLSYTELWQPCRHSSSITVIQLYQNGVVNWSRITEMWNDKFHHLTLSDASGKSRTCRVSLYAPPSTALHLWSSYTNLQFVNMFRNSATHVTMFLNGFVAF